ncbi:hypothetical protein Q1695_006313 [Nippostrongylus brasiliensis]|nr:hypothetical protein Q1695_006313 [Nippostrongylus brasiliensis]
MEVVETHYSHNQFLHFIKIDDTYDRETETLGNQTNSYRNPTNFERNFCHEEERNEVYFHNTERRCCSARNHWRTCTPSL